MVRQTVYVLVLFWCVLTTKAWAAESSQALVLAHKVQALYQATKSFTADFEQEVFWRRAESMRLSKGKVWFKRPGCMRWEYTWPERYLIVSDGKEVYLYSPADNQVLILPWNRAVSPKVTLGFLTGKGNLLKDFVLLGAEQLGSDLWALDLRPREENPQVERLRLVVKKDGLIQALWFWDYLGNLTKIRFKHLKRNVRLKDELFIFTPPKGVEIIKEE